MDERREFQRIRFREPVQYVQAGGGVAKGCSAMDLSTGGLQFRTEDFIPLETKMTFDLPLASDRVVGMHGKVVWIQKLPHADSYYVGLKFLETSISLESKHALGQYIEFEGKPPQPRGRQLPR